MKLEIQTGSRIGTSLTLCKGIILQDEYSRKKWVSVESLLEFINDQRDNGNLEGESGFSAALCLSELLKRLEEKC